MSRFSRYSSIQLVIFVCLYYIVRIECAWNGVPLGNSPKTMGLKRSIGSDEQDEVNDSAGKSSASRKEREQLYEAYNHLHTLAQDFHKPFDAPAVIVVGHQTSGKSALIEALMGFQFNQVMHSSRVSYVAITNLS